MLKFPKEIRDMLILRINYWSSCGAKELPHPFLKFMQFPSKLVALWEVRPLSEGRPLPLWTDKYLWNHYLPHTPYAGGNNKLVFPLFLGWCTSLGKTGSAAVGRKSHSVMTIAFVCEQRYILYNFLEIKIIPVWHSPGLGCQSPSAVQVTRLAPL